MPQKKQKEDTEDTKNTEDFCKCGHIGYHEYSGFHWIPRIAAKKGIRECLYCHKPKKRE